MYLYFSLKIKMVKFAHLADCHLGGWRYPELQEMNFLTFQKIVDKCINEKVDFILFAGDLFDSAYPPIEILKRSFTEFKRIYDAKIPVYMIAGSHDYSASGKTFLDVLERAGFCKNVEKWEEQEDGKLKLLPTMHGEIAIYGYPGKKSGMEIEDLKRVYFDSANQFTIFMLHTTIKDVIGTLPIDYLEKEKLPLANYYAMGHIHKRFEEDFRNSKYVYPGPIYPANFQELSDLRCGSFQMVEVNGGKIKTENVKFPLREVVCIEIELESGLNATQKIILELDKLNLKDKIVLMKLFGTLKQGKTGDIRFGEIEEFVTKKEAYVFIRNISSINIEESILEFKKTKEENIEGIEREILKEYSEKNFSDFNKFLPQLMNCLCIDKNEDEKSAIYEERLLSELSNILQISEIL